MAEEKKRLTAVLDEAAEEGGAEALLEALKADELGDLPEVKKAIKADAKLRKMEEDDVRQKIAVPYVQEKHGLAEEENAEADSASSSSSRKRGKRGKAAAHGETSEGGGEAG